MKSTGVGIATDYTIITATAPRFGKYACWSARPDLTKVRKGQLPPFADQYQVGKQKNPVLYKDSDASGLEAYRLGKRTYDFNEDGLANYGLLPDLLQDSKNVGLPAESLAALFSSAEGFLTTWEKAERLSGAGSPPFTPLELPCEIACHGLCPLSPNAGAPHK